MCPNISRKHNYGYGIVGQPIPISEPTNSESIISYLNYTMSNSTLQQLVDEIVNNNKLTEKEKKDRLFEMDCVMYTNLGSDSTKKDREETKKKSRVIYKGIREIDFYLGCALLRTQDDKKKAQ